MESSIVPLGNTEAPPLPPPTTVADASLTSQLDSSMALLPSTQAPAAVLANAVPPSHSSIPHHPPYAEMITTAISALNDRKGSSRTAIKKYIDTIYSNLPVSHEALLSLHLKRLKINGVVEMVKHSYKLPKKVIPAASSGAAEVRALGKRSRGRPPKPKPLEASGPALPKRRPGRPPKDKSNPIPVVRGSGRRPGRPPKDNSNPISQQKRVSGRRPGRPPKDKSKPISVIIDGQQQQKRGRGRPPRPKPIILLASNGFIAPPKPRRRPKKPKIVTVTPSYYAPVIQPKQPRKPPKLRAFVASAGGGKSTATGSPRPRGRPRKNASEVGPSGFVNKACSNRPRGRPPKVPENVVSGAPMVVVLPYATGGSSNAVTPEKRGRGRPPKSPTMPKRSSNAVPPPYSAGGSSNAVSPEKRGRGRPPKSGGPPMPPMLKRSVGRPKKVTVNTTTVG